MTILMGTKTQRGPTLAGSIPVHLTVAEAPVLRQATVIMTDLCLRFLSVPSSWYRIPFRLSAFRLI